MKILDEKGQTLLEVIIATAILGVGLVAILGLVIQSLVTQESSKERTQATFLAQEAIEFAHNLRDSNIKNEDPWNYQFGTGSGNFSGNGYYKRELVGQYFEFLGTDKTEDGFSSTNILEGTPFYRYIYMFNYNGEEDKIEILVEVYWPRPYDQNPDGHVSLSEIISDWKK